MKSTAGHCVWSVARRTGSLLIFLALSIPCFGAGTLVQIQANGNLVSDTNPLPIKAEASAGTTHVIIDSGTSAVTQSGTWTVQPGNTANTTAWKVDNSAVTQPISAASLPLPVGASTAANQTTVQATVNSVVGQNVYLRDSSDGSLINTSNPVQIFVSNTYLNITSNATTTVKSGTGTFSRFCVNQIGTTETVTVYDNTAASGTKIATLGGLTAGQCLVYDVAFGTGLTIVTSGSVAGDWTVAYR